MSVNKYIEVAKVNFLCVVLVDIKITHSESILHSVPK